MQGLKENLELAAKYANEHSTRAQSRYAAAYNIRAREKRFSVGDKVMVLAPPDSVKKGYCKWTGPHIVTEVNTPHSYVVELDQGARHHIHINKMRPFIASV
jgi:hypothetical protein